MLEDLPVEVKEIILLEQCLSHLDIAHLSCVSKKLNEVCNSNEVWKFKFQDKWEHLWLQIVQDVASNWKEWFKKRYLIGLRVQKELLKMSPLFYKKEELAKEAFAQLKLMLYEHQFGYDFVVDEMQSIMKDGEPHKRLTMKYYADKTLCYIQQLHLQEKWESYIMLPLEEQCIEKGAIMLAQWFQPTDTVDEIEISDLLDNIAMSVVDHFSRKHGDHPLVLRGLIRMDHLKESLWSPSICKELLITLNYVLFQESGFYGDNENYYSPDNSYINKVLDKKTGIPITLCIVYLCITKRLGVCCEPVGFPMHFILRWKEYPDQLMDEQKFTFIDVFNKGVFVRYENLKGLIELGNPVEPSMVAAVPPIMVFERMARNLMEVGRRLGNMGNGLLCLRNGLEFLLILCPDDIEARLLLARIYLHLNINLNEVQANLQEVLHRDPSQTGIVAHMYQSCQSQLRPTQFLNETEMIVPSKRPADGSVNFAVGMVMRHKRYEYMCVIYGWDSVCTASREWITHMGVNILPKGEKQPFYNVLVRDLSMRYAAQENLVVHSDPGFINHPDIGRYFKEFTGTHFVQNSESRKEYPEDEAILQQFEASRRSQSKGAALSTPQ